MMLSKKKGFSLVEVMVVIAIMTILMMAAISSFTFYYKTFAETRLTNLQKLTEYSVIRVRSDGETVIVCAADAEASFDKQGKLDSNTFKCFTGKDDTRWGDRPIVAFESPNGNIIYNAANGDTIIGNLGEGHDENLYINLSGNPSYVKISPNGFMATGNGNITYCDRTNKYQAALIINLVGRVIYTDSQAKESGGLYTCE
ncbi:type IV pili fiber building block protein [Francisella halioticida]|uniref:Type IV pili fiber building block protein n=1 Tax=Francisella halioticida TaxID=549298 RepID=A0ABM6LZA7_9GAMM|nr:prepilin-type N-terminal cleavage/methylation domain-containing protein [Francisella halioticida]ASG68010.1 type IV pili fiber building block protein [Francisella halioticida]BCD90430.1 type IV pili fiber building block protein [Francisella halioticida]